VRIIAASGGTNMSIYSRSATHVLWRLRPCRGRSDPPEEAFWKASMTASAMHASRGIDVLHAHEAVGGAPAAGVLHARRDRGAGRRHAKSAHLPAFAASELVSCACFCGCESVRVNETDDLDVCPETVAATTVDGGRPMPRCLSRQQWGGASSATKCSECRFEWPGWDFC
jgi:hypothetical protein